MVKLAEKNNSFLVAFIQNKYTFKEISQKKTTYENCFHKLHKFLDLLTIEAFFRERSTVNHLSYLCCPSIYHCPGPLLNRIRLTNSLDYLIYTSLSVTILKKDISDHNTTNIKGSNLGLMSCQRAKSGYKIVQYLFKLNIFL